MTLNDGHTRRCLAIRVVRHLKGVEVIDTHLGAMPVDGVLTYIRCNNGPKMTSKLLRDWLEQVGART
jgi:hypothetical protein